MSTDAARPYAAILILGLVVVCGAFWADCLFGAFTPLAAGFQAEMEPWASEADLPGTDRQWSPLLWDGVAQFYPWRLLAARAMSAGEFAFWNPHQMCGYPFVGNGQSALFYPPNWILALVNVKWGMGLLAALHYALAAVLTALLCRALGLGRIPSAFAGIAFTFGGFMVTWTELPTLMNAAAWLPGALLGVALIFKRSRWGVPVLGVSLAMTLLAGHFQIATYVWMAAAAYALARVTWEALGRRPTRLAALSAAVGLGLLLGSAQILPTLELAVNSPRGQGGPSEAGWEFHERLAMQPGEWWTFFDPDAFGNPAHGDHELTRYGIPYSEHCGFVGIITLLLATAGLVFHRGRNYMFFVFLAVTAVHISMAGTLAKFMYMYVPGLGQAGSFARALCVFTFAAAMAAAFGLEGICQRARECDGACGESGRCRWNLRPATALCLVTLVILGWELLPWAHEFLPRTHREHVYPVTPAIARLMATEGRVLAVTPHETWSMERTPEAVLAPNAATVYGYESIAGYDSLMLTTYRGFLMQAENAEPAPATNGNMLLPQDAVGSRQMLMGVEEVLARRRPEENGAQTMRIVSSHGGVALYHVQPVAPRAFTLPSFEWTSVFLEEAADGPMQTLEPCGWRRQGNGNIKIELPPGNGNRALVVTETFYPGWSAYSDGEPRMVHPVAGSTFCGIRTHDGDCVIDLVFEPAAVRIGCFLPLIALSLLAGMIAAGRRVGRVD